MMRHEYQGRIVRIVDEYDDGPHDNGYIYVFEDEPGKRHWISTSSAAIRFRKIEPPACND